MEGTPAGHDGEDLRSAARYLHLGWQLAITILVFTLGGWWLDGRLGIAPWATLVGATLGISAGLFVFIRATIRTEEPHDRGPGHG